MKQIISSVFFPEEGRNTHGYHGWNQQALMKYCGVGAWSGAPIVSNLSRGDEDDNGAVW